MYRLTILYAPEDEEYAGPAKQLGNAFSELGLDVVVKAAKNAGISDILAADIVIFGSSVLKPYLHPHFTEMVRAFKGINLAGKCAGFLSYSGNNAPKLFRKALRDTDIYEFRRDLIINSGSTKPDELTKWAKELFKRYEEGIYG